MGPLVGLKVCQTCGEMAEHLRKILAADGLQPECRDCAAARLRDKYHAWRSEALARLGPCIDCGSWQRLEFDHVDPETKLDSVSSLFLSKKRDAELAKCVVRCRPCHVRKHSGGPRVDLRRAA